jgi:Tfp pilus assembly protein PilF
VDKKLFYTLTMVASLPAIGVGCATTTNRPGAQPSWTEQMGDSIKSGAAKMTAFVTRKPEVPGEPEKELNHKPGPGVMVALAQIAEKQGNLEEAEIHYRKALDLDPNCLAALVGYAHLEDGRNNFEAARKLYLKALKKHGAEPSVHNDLGLCYHRHGMLPQATKSLEKAIELQPARKLYHDNLAAVLVEQDRKEEALKQLVVAHGEAIGNYNLAFLLAQKPNKSIAVPYFQHALALDPSLVQAQQWIAQLSHPRHELPNAQVRIAAASPAARQPTPPTAEIARPANPVIATSGIAEIVRPAQGSESTAASAAPRTPAAEREDMSILPKRSTSGTADVDGAPCMQTPDGRLPAISSTRS